MAHGKQYFWIKLKTDFMTSDKVDYLMSQSNGAEYVVLYQMLCMKCINTDGFLARQIGEVIIPFDAEKIARDCKYFSIDTVKMALHLFIQLGMIYQETNGFLKIAEFENMVGSETDWAEKKRIQRQNKKQQLINDGNTGMDNVQENVQENVHEILEIDIRDRDRYINSKSCEKSDVQEIKKCWNDMYIKIFNKKPDSSITDSKSNKSFWAGITNLIKKRLKKYSSTDLINAINYAEFENWIVQGDFQLSTILSDTVVIKAMQNIPHSVNKNSVQKSLDEKKEYWF